MQTCRLGQTGIMISRLCFGTLTIGPLQANLPLAEGAAVLQAALAAGVNFIDTAELYGTYPYIRRALAGWEKDVVIATKSYAYTREAMAASLEKARRELGRDCIDIFLLHEQESALTLKGHAPALEYLWEAKARGWVKAVGVSTHTVEMVRHAATHPGIEVIHPLFNIEGIGIRDGTAADMAEAIAKAHRAGKGIYAMKALGGGHLIRRAPEALRFVLDNPHIHAIAVGMKTRDEVAVNTAIFAGRPVPPEHAARVALVSRQLHIEDWCAGCGACAARCPAGALAVREGKITVDRDKCILCGYCGARCPEFCLKII